MKEFFSQLCANVLGIVYVPFNLMGMAVDAIRGGHPMVFALMFCLVEGVVYWQLWRLTERIKPPLKASDAWASHPAVERYMRISRVALRALLIVIHLAFYKTLWYDPYHVDFDRKIFPSAAEIWVALIALVAGMLYVLVAYGATAVESTEGST